MREQVNFQWDDDEVRFVLDQHALMDVNNTSSLKQQSTDRHVASLGHINLFPIVNFPFICSNMPAAPVYGVYISQLIRYSRACGYCADFLEIRLLLTRKLLNHNNDVSGLLILSCHLRF